MTQKRSFTEEQAAEYLGVSRSLLRQCRSTGHRDDRIGGPPWLRMGKRSIRYLRDDLDRWLESFPRFSDHGEHP